VTDKQGFLEAWNIYTDRRLLVQQLAGIGTGALGSGRAAVAAASSAAARGIERCGSEEAAGYSELLSSCSVILFARRPCLFVTSETQLQTWTVLRDLKFEEYEGHSDAVVGLACAALDDSYSGKAEADEHTKTNGFMLFSAGIDNVLCGWDWYDMSCLYRLREPESEIACMAKVPDATMVATGNQDGTIRLWSCDTGSTVLLYGHRNTVSCLDVASRKRMTLLLSAGFDGQIGVWDITRRQLVKPRLECMFRAQRSHRNTLQQSDSAPEGKLANDPHLRQMLEEDSGEEILCIRYCPGTSSQTTVSVPKLSALGISPNSTEFRPDTFLTGGNDAVIRLWHLSTFELLCELEGHTDAVTCLQVDANFVISGSEDATVRVWNVSDVKHGQQISVLRAHTQTIRDIVVLPGHSVANLASCSADGTLKVWDYTSLALDADDLAAAEADSGTMPDVPEGGKVLQEFHSTGSGGFQCIAHCQPRNELLVGTRDGRIVVHALP